MTKEELKDIARRGVRALLLDYEGKLADLYAEFPEAFATPRAPILARSPLRNDTNHNSKGHGARVAKKSKKQQPAYGSSLAVHKRRALSAKILDAVAASDKPLPLAKIAKTHNGAARSIMPLIRRGYLKKAGEGYVRTEKMFYVNPYDRERAKRAQRA